MSVMCQGRGFQFGCLWLPVRADGFATPMLLGEASLRGDLPRHGLSFGFALYHLNVPSMPLVPVLLVVPGMGAYRNMSSCAVKGSWCACASPCSLPLAAHKQQRASRMVRWGTWHMRWLGKPPGWLQRADAWKKQNARLLLVCGASAALQQCLSLYYLLAPPPGECNGRR
jgi:hypothetical protein